MGGRRGIRTMYKDSNVLALDDFVCIVDHIVHLPPILEHEEVVAEAFEW